MAQQNGLVGIYFKFLPEISLCFLTITGYSRYLYMLQYLAYLVLLAAYIYTQQMIGRYIKEIRKGGKLRYIRGRSVALPLAHRP